MQSRAKVLRGPKILVDDTWPLPVVGEFDGILRVEACGICGTDYEQYAGDLLADQFRTPYPSIPGHEPVGRIVELGDTAASRWGVRVGDRVAVRPVYGCGHCEACQRGDGPACRSRGGTYGLTSVDKAPSLWGGYSEFMYLHPLSTVVPLSDEVDPAVGTLVNPLACGLSWAGKVPRTEEGETVVVLGSGQRGLCCVVAAKRAGAKSIVVTGLARDASKLDLARKLGATETIEADSGRSVRDAVLDVIGRAGADVVIDTTPVAPTSLSDAIAIAAQRGRLVLAGIKGRKAAPDVFQDDITLKQLSLFGVSATDAEDFRAAAGLMNDTAVRSSLSAMHTRSFPLEAAEEAVLAAAGVRGGPSVVHVAIEPA